MCGLSIGGGWEGAAAVIEENILSGILLLLCSLQCVNIACGGGVSVCVRWKCQW